MRRFRPAALAVLALGVGGLPSAAREDRPQVVVTVSVDWEGRDLGEANLRAFEAFRAALPGVPLTHFLSGAYYTKEGATKEAITRQIRRAMQPGDEVGHHVHVWRSLVEAAGVPFREGPTFWGDGAPLGRATHGDVGHEVEVTAYTTEEVRKIVAEGVRRLRTNGFNVSGSFRAGGWVADARVLEAIRAEGFTVDSSAVDAEWHTRLRHLRLPGRIRELWPEVRGHTQPFAVSTPAGTVIEMPDTGALADYVSADQMREHLRAALARAEANPRETVYVHVGFHQETASSYASRVREALTPFLDDPRVSFQTLEDAATSARPTLGPARPRPDAIVPAGGATRGLPIPGRVSRVRRLVERLFAGVRSRRTTQRDTQAFAARRLTERVLVSRSARRGERVVEARSGSFGILGRLKGRSLRDASARRAERNRRRSR